jgi:tetratricopeptide (TPR) repeat protein
VLVFVAAVSLSFPVFAWFQEWPGNRIPQENDLLAILIGDGRKLFANHFFAKADAYFHSGYYPSIFDNAPGFKNAHIAEDTRSGEEHEEESGHAFLGASHDWIEQFGRQFFPSTHTHLDEKGNGSEVRELLPWLKFSAELDPQKIESYTVAAYWLRQRLGRSSEAEAFLREGLRANPHSYAILFELGRIAEEDKHNDQAARNLWELALRRWNEQQSNVKDPDLFQRNEITSRLALLEQRNGNYAKALAYMRLWKSSSPTPDKVQNLIDQLLAAHPEATIAPPAR